MKTRALLVGTVSNVASKIEKDLTILLSALKHFDEVKVFLVESDSEDTTLIKLLDLKKESKNLNFISLETLRSTIPDRIERIRYCRNHYIEFIRNHQENKQWDFIVVADLDGMNSKINSAGIASCFKDSPTWDVVTANQAGGYYDLYALRHRFWMPNDCFSELLWYNSIQISYKIAGKSMFWKFREYKIKSANRNRIVYTKMLKNLPGSDWIEVDSAFGGLAFINLNHSYIMTIQK